MPCLGAPTWDTVPLSELGASHATASGSAHPLPCCSFPLPLGFISILLPLGSPFFCFPPPHPSLFQRPGLDVLALRKIQPPASCQLCLWPIAPVSCLTLIPQFIQRRPLGQTERLRNLPETSAFPKPYKQFPASIPAPAAHAALPARDAGPAGADGMPWGAPRCPISPPSPAAWQPPLPALRVPSERAAPRTDGK